MLPSSSFSPRIHVNDGIPSAASDARGMRLQASVQTLRNADAGEAAQALPGETHCPGRVAPGPAALMAVLHTRANAGIAGALVPAAAGGQIGGARTLPPGSADIDADLAQAVRDGEADAAKALLEAGANSFAADVRRAMLHALYRGDTRMAGIFIDAKACMDLRAPGGLTPLMLAAQQGNAGLVDVLLRGVYDIDAVDDHGYTALMVAAQSGHTAIAAKLVDSGAAVLDYADDDASPMKLARLHGHHETEQMLLHALAQSLAAGTHGCSSAAAGTRPGI